MPTVLKKVLADSLSGRVKSWTETWGSGEKDDDIQKLEAAHASLKKYWDEKMPLPEEADTDLVAKYNDLGSKIDALFKEAVPNDGVKRREQTVKIAAKEVEAKALATEIEQAAAEQRKKALAQQKEKEAAARKQQKDEALAVKTAREDKARAADLQKRFAALSKEHPVAVTKASELKPYRPDLSARLDAAWKKCSKPPDTITEQESVGVVKAFDELKTLLSETTNDHSLLTAHKMALEDFDKVWVLYDTQFNKVKIPAGPTCTAVAAMATAAKKTVDDVRTILDSGSATAFQSAKTEIRKLTPQLAHYAKFETEYPIIAAKLLALRSKALHSKQEAALAKLEAVALNLRIDDPKTAVDKLDDLDRKIASVDATLASWTAPVTAPKLQGGSGFDYATTADAAVSAAKRLIEDGGITKDNIGRLVPKGANNVFTATPQFPDGFKYTWQSGGMELTVYGHGPSGVAGTDSNKGNLVRVKVGDKYLRPDGELTDDRFDEASHMAMY